MSSKPSADPFGCLGKDSQRFSDAFSDTSSASSDMKTAKCTVCRYPEQVPTKPFIQCTGCKHYYHLSCHNPGIPVTAAPEPRCVKTGRGPAITQSQPGSSTMDRTHPLREPANAYQKKCTKCGKQVIVFTGRSLCTGCEKAERFEKSRVSHAEKVARDAEILKASSKSFPKNRRHEDTEELRWPPSRFERDRPTTGSVLTSHQHNTFEPEMYSTPNGPRGSSIQKRKVDFISKGSRKQNMAADKQLSSSFSTLRNEPAVRRSESVGEKPLHQNSPKYTMGRTPQYSSRLLTVDCAPCTKSVVVPALPTKVHKTSLYPVDDTVELNQKYDSPSRKERQSHIKNNGRDGEENSLSSDSGDHLMASSVQVKMLSSHPARDDVGFHPSLNSVMPTLPRLTNISEDGVQSGGADEVGNQICPCDVRTGTPPTKHKASNPAIYTYGKDSFSSGNIDLAGNLGDIALEVNDFESSIDKNIDENMFGRITPLDDESLFEARIETGDIRPAPSEAIICDPYTVNVPDGETESTSKRCAGPTQHESLQIPELSPGSDMKLTKSVQIDENDMATSPSPQSLVAMSEANATLYDVSRVDRHLYPDSKAENHIHGEKIDGYPIWGHFDPRQQWNQEERSEEWLKQKKKEIAARGGRKSQYGKVATSQMIKGRLAKGWGKNQVISNKPPNLNDQNWNPLRDLFGVPDKMEPILYKGKLAMAEPLVPNARGIKPRLTLNKVWMVER